MSEEHEGDALALTPEDVAEAERWDAYSRVREAMPMLLELWPKPIPVSRWAVDHGSPVVYCADRRVHRSGEEPRLGLLPVAVPDMEVYPNEWWVRNPVRGRDQLAPIHFGWSDVEEWYVELELAEPGQLLRWALGKRFPDVPLALDENGDPVSWGEWIEFWTPLPEGARPKYAYACPQCCHKVGASPELMSGIGRSLRDAGIGAVSLRQLDDLLMRTGQRRTRRP